MLSTTSTEDTPEAAVTLSDSNEFQFSFKLQRGQDGVNGTAPNYKTYVYAQSNSKPEKPDFNTPQPPTESQ